MDPAYAPAPAPVKAKVCGVRAPDEAAALDAMGVAWIGFNFHPASSRYVAPAAAAVMARNLKQAKAVGVFVDAPIDLVISVVESVGLDFVQLHGSEDREYALRLPVPVIKAFPHPRLADWGGWRAALEADPGRRDSAAAGRAGGKGNPPAFFLVDTAAGSPAAGTAAGGFGGSGKAFDWGLLRGFSPPRPYFLAGGLGPENLAAVLALRPLPYAVDLNSKVEIAPGRKDLGKVKACLDLIAAGSRPLPSA